MLYIIGGAARAGKSIIARRLVSECEVPYFNLDFLMMGLAKGLSDSGVNPEASSSEVAAKIWPIVRAMAINILEVGIDYLIEGDTIEPRQVKELSLLFPR